MFLCVPVTDSLYPQPEARILFSGVHVPKALELALVISNVGMR